MSSPAMTAGTGRAALVTAARERWIERLIDLTRRNNLLYFRDLKVGTLDLSGAPPEVLQSFRAGRTVPLAKLVPNAGEAELAASALEIRHRALLNREEKGLETLHVGVGMATWRPRDDGRPPEAPVLLVPVLLETRGRDGRTATLTRAEGDIQANLVLLHALEAGYGVSLPPERLTEAVDIDTGDGQDIPLARAFEVLRAAAQEIPAFDVRPRFVLGNFSFQKMAMVNDLRRHAGTLETSDLVAALAGDVPARQAVLASRRPVEADRLDRVPPDEEFLVLDADSTQQRVIAAVVASQDGVIQGPPGTGKSQTISNLIAELSARGRRVLFVAEKRAALDVVLKRLEQSGLGHLALDLHGAEITRKDVMRRIAESLGVVRESVPVDAAACHARLLERRERLNVHIDRVHGPRPPGDLSVYQLSGRLLPGSPLPRAATRWTGADLDRLDRAAVLRIRDLLVEAAGFERLFLRNDPSPWTGAAITTGAESARALDLAGRLHGGAWQDFDDAVRRVVDAAGLAVPATVADATVLLDLASQVRDVQEHYDPAVWKLDQATTLADLAPATRGPFIRFLAGLLNGRYRRARASVTSLRRTPQASPAALHSEMERIGKIAVAWREREGASAPPVPAPDADARSRLDQVTALLGELLPLLGRDPAALPFADAGGFWSALAQDAVTPHRFPRLHEIERELSSCRLDAWIRELRGLAGGASAIGAALWPDFFEQAWIQSAFDRALAGDPSIGGFNGRTHDRMVDDFRELDRERITIAAGRVRRAHAERAIAAMNAHPDQDALVRREAAKKARHLPLRTLLAEAPEVMTALRPCWMASPLTVSQLLDGRRHFDVVLFDEASQILPEDAIPSLMRAGRAVAAGDRNQLPPTTFFMAGDEDEETSTDAPGEGFESLLDLMASFLEPWSLEWHYRSRDESLIAFSNHHIYGDRLVTFPGPGGPPVLSHVLVEATGGAGGEAAADIPAETESSRAEVTRVVDLVLEHAVRRPGESLGVIAMGIPHARRIEEALETALRARSELAGYFDISREDRFFVKNLERVQGDERDAIILTVGYGKDRSGRLPYRFGPLLQKGGERRLNVAVTRARKRLTLVSSFSHHHMTPGRSQARGVELLREYLEYASQGGHRPPAEGVLPALDDYQASVHDALLAAGLKPLPLFGASRRRIDFAVRHPDDPARFVLAVECDGPSYAAFATARDRDRLRRQHLESLGWRHHRIWSLDWFLRRDEEMERLLEALRGATGPVPAAPEGEKPSDTAGMPARTRRPAIPRRENIDDYNPRDIAALLDWIESDGRLRTDDEILDELTEVLGFRRRGARIEAVLTEAIRRRRPSR